METIETVLILLLFTGILSFLGRYLKIAHEIFLVIGGVFIGFLPGVREVKLAPEVVFLIFLPPLLSYAAYYTSWREFKTYIRPISLLAIGAVLFTASAVAITLKILIPEIPIAIAFLLGAVVSPPDASAVTAIVKNLNVPDRMITILEGESLINDATALVVFRFALKAVILGSFSLFQASLQFFLVSIGGLLVGLGISYLNIEVRKRVDDLSLQLVIGLLTPFFAYIVAEHLQVSGVISTVVAGIFVSYKNPVISSPLYRRKSGSIWEMMIFIINSLAFILIGLQLPSIFKSISVYPVSELVILSIGVVSAVVIARFAWTFPAAFLPYLIPSIRRKERMPSWKAVFVTCFAGMRGIVSIAAALAIPLYTDTSTKFPFPYRDLVIFLTYIVVLVTLVVPGLTLPYLIKAFELEKEGSQEQEEKDARIACAEASLLALDQIPMDSKIAFSHIDVLKQEYMNVINKQSYRIPTELATQSLHMEKEVIELKLDLIQRQRKLLINLRNKELIHDHVMLKIQSELDQKELGLRS
ncbi:MAG: Na+/H+ antiporter [Leptospiraceae bacterium]|nr:Na+/H+ antiporter [Leptospiraceae bacterium]